MAQSDLNCANLALRLLGNRAVLTALSDTSTEGLACNANIDDCKRALLRATEANFATKRKNVTATFTTISNIGNNGGEYQVTSVGHLLATGDSVTIRSADSFSGLNGTWVVTVNSGTQFTLDGSIYGAGTGTDYGEWTRAAAFGYAYMIDLPTDCLRVLDVNGSQELADSIRIESGKILSDDDALEIRYIKDVTDYTLMDPLFYQCLAHYLAYNLCDHITASDGKKNELHGYLYGTNGKRGLMSQFKFADSTEDGAIQNETSDWVSARYQEVGE